MPANGGPAFPVNEPVTVYRDNSDRIGRIVAGPSTGGMSLRDYFAGQALVGWVTRGAVKNIADGLNTSGSNALPILAEGCYLLADAMLTAREAK